MSTARRRPDGCYPGVGCFTCTLHPDTCPLPSDVPVTKIEAAMLKRSKEKNPHHEDGGTIKIGKIILPNYNTPVGRW